MPTSDRAASERHPHIAPAQLGQVEPNVPPGHAASRVPLVALLRVDPDLGDGLSEADRAEAGRRVLSPVLGFKPGSWSPGDTRPSGLLTMLLLDGFLAREIELGGRRYSQLIGPGAPVDPWVENAPDGFQTVAWKALTPIQFAVLEDRFARAALQWPALLSGLIRRTSEWAEHLVAMSVAAQRPRMDLRILTAMWHLAQRWGKVTSDGILLDLPITHETLGAMLGSRRPTVTLALNDLATAGMLERRADGSWLLSAKARPFAGDASGGTLSTLVKSVKRDAPPRTSAPPGRGPSERAAEAGVRAQAARSRAVEAAKRSAMLHDELARISELQGETHQAEDHRAWADYERQRAERYANDD